MITAAPQVQGAHKKRIITSTVLREDVVSLKGLLWCLERKEKCNSAQIGEEVVKEEEVRSAGCVRFWDAPNSMLSTCSCGVSLTVTCPLRRALDASQ